MVAFIAADSGHLERCVDWLVEGQALVLRGVAGGLRGLLCTCSRGVPTVPAPDELCAPVAR
jgi:hypothetical protein